MHRRILTLISVGVLALGLAACGSSSKSSTPAATTPGATTPAASTSDAAITIDSGFTFNVTPVKAGSTVTVKNTSSSNHTVTANDGSFDVALDANGTATFTAPSKPGTYEFHCKIHNFMTAKLTVN